MDRIDGPELDVPHRSDPQNASCGIEALDSTRPYGLSLVVHVSEYEYGDRRNWIRWRGSGELWAGRLLAGFPR